MNEETKVKVKDLPETERAELIKQMELAGCMGNCGEYKVETAKNKIAEWQESQKSAGENSGDNVQGQLGQDDTEKENEQEAQNVTNPDMAPLNATPPQAGRSGLGRSLMPAPSVAPAPTEQKSFELPGVKVPQNQSDRSACASSTDNAAPAYAGQKKKICHICWNEVINGVCTGCGFKL